jgi:glycosyltransferase involved in cell wall biosynthesis
MKNALLIGFTLPPEIVERIYKVDTLPAVQTTKFAWNFVDAISTRFTTVRLLSFSPVQNFPRGRKIVFHSFSFSRGRVTGKHLGFVNLLVLKHLSRLFQLFARARPDVVAQRPDVVFIHGVHSPLLIFGVYLVRKGYCVIPVLTDPPGVILPTDTFLSRRLKRLDSALVRGLLSKFSGVITLSDGLAQQYAKGLRKLVFPGIASNDIPEQLLPELPSASLSAAPEVVYAGTISASYGVRRLVEAARLLPRIRFSFFGSGDLVAEITSAQLPNVTLHGFVPPEDLPVRLKGASLLVNCRSSGDQVAAMSFPSKLIEYALTGVPVLTTPLPSIPVNLRDAFIYVSEETGEGFAKAIKETLSASRADLQSQGRKARALILESYSDKAIGAEIFDFIKSLRRS